MPTETVHKHKVRFGIQNMNYVTNEGKVITRRQLCDAIDRKFKGNYDELLKYILVVVNYSIAARSWVLKDFFDVEGKEIKNDTVNK